MIDLKDMFGQRTTPSARITSAIVSILILSLLFFGIIKEEWKIYAYGFLGFHLINHLIAGFSDLKVYTCPYCDLKLEHETKLKKHVCKKMKKVVAGS